MSSDPKFDRRYKKVRVVAVAGPPRVRPPAQLVPPLPAANAVQSSGPQQPPLAPATLLPGPQIWAEIEALPAEQQQQLRGEALEHLLRRRRVKVDGKVC
jgi:hypothetical protein